MPHLGKRHGLYLILEPNTEGLTSITSPFTEIYCIGLYRLCVIFTIVYTEQMAPINRSLALLISFYSGYEDVDKAIHVCEQVPATSYRSPVTYDT